MRADTPLCLLQELGYPELLEQEEVQAGILTANQRAEKERASECLGEHLLQVLLPRSLGMAASCSPAASPSLSVLQCCRLWAGSTLLFARGCQQKPWKH